jgi:hypothetical protein
MWAVVSTEILKTGESMRRKFTYRHAKFHVELGIIIKEEKSY